MVPAATLTAEASLFAVESCGHAPWDLHSLHNPHFQHLISLGLRFLSDVAAEMRAHTQQAHKWEDVR